MKTKYVSLRWWDLPAAMLLMAAILISGTRLVATGWTAHLSIVQTIVFFGLIAGLALGYSHFSPRSAAFIALIYGIFTIPWQLGLTLPVQYSWTEKMIILIYRLQTVISQLVLREPVRELAAFPGHYVRFVLDYFGSCRICNDKIWRWLACDPARWLDNVRHPLV